MAVATKTKRMVVRMTPEVKCLAMQAAALQGVTLTAFVREAARQAAMEVLEPIGRLPVAVAEHGAEDAGDEPVDQGAD